MPTEQKRHKHSRNHSPYEEEEHKRKKSHKRHHSESSSEEESESVRRKQHKHKHGKEGRHKKSSGSREELRDEISGGERGRNHKSESNDMGREDLSNRHRRHGSADRQGRSREHVSHHHSHRSRRSSTEFDPSIRIKQEKDDRNFQQQQRVRQEYNERRRDARRDRDIAGGDHGLNTDAPRVKSEPGTVNPENVGEKENETAERQQPNFGLSGKLTEDTNTFRGVVIKYNEPPEAMKPKRRWRLYPFKGQESLPVLHIHRQSAFLLGRDRRIADIPVDHPSCSKQQAVLQFRAMPYTRPDGTPGRRVRPYIIDLESANGTYLNGEQIEASRYYELKEKDVIKFGFSSREYVVLHDAVDVSEVVAGEDMEEA
ncbi:hypothetical protein EGW08_011225 [Elysia chlorotica]|uniref:FHA domain-containing protein n=1 Tax=Elysia chlorotica TaxID=188477 RepID=A0A433THH5_ELYCH|nr:hypothetical protein EGW08_011225 [Elysia chlorotica]